MVDGDRTLTPPVDPGRSPPPDIDPGFQPEAVRLVGDVETLRAMSDPTRMRILETMVTRMDPAWSVKDLAASLGVPQTRLYHHVDLLAARGLVRAVEQRVVSGIIETRYRVAARSFQLDRRLFAGDEDESRRVLHETIIAMFDTARSEIEAAIHLGLADPAGDAPEHRRLMLSRGIARLSPERAAELYRRLRELEAEFDQDEAPDGEPYGLVVAVYPLPTISEPDDA